MKKQIRLASQGVPGIHLPVLPICMCSKAMFSITEAAGAGAAVESQSLERRTAEKMVDRVNRLKDISAEMAEELGREATVEELARRMELTGDEIRDVMKVTLDAMSVVER